MAIKNISAEMGNSISHVTTRVRSIGRKTAQPTGVFQRRKMIGMDIARVGSNYPGANSGFAGSNLSPNPFSFSGTGFNRGSIVDADGLYKSRRFGNMDSNLGFNRIPGLQRK